MGEATLRTLLEAGVTLFDAGRYFEAHEAWEDLWKSANSPLALLFKGLAQLSVSLEHARRGNFRGAKSVGMRGLALLTQERHRLCLNWLDQLLEQVQRYLYGLDTGLQVARFKLPEELLSLPLETGDPGRSS